MKWTEEKLELLRRRYPHEDNGALARELGVSRKALAYQASCRGIRKTFSCNEARYAAMGKKLPAHLLQGDLRQIESGTLITRGNVTTHSSRYSLVQGET